MSLPERRLATLLSSGVEPRRSVADEDAQGSGWGMQPRSELTGRSVSGKKARHALDGMSGSGTWRTLILATRMSANDPKRTFHGEAVGLK